MIKFTLIRHVVNFLVVMTLLGCNQTIEPRFQASTSIVPTTISPFTAYQEEVRHWLTANRVTTLGDITWEVALNSPTQCNPQQTQQGILLVHGLGDSPYFFRDIAATLCEQGYLVRTILLPGHGSKPGDMRNVDYAMWENTVNFHLQELAEKVNQVFVGGFSTGANLAVISALGQQDIAGLLLFSPAFSAKFSVLGASPYLTSILPWPNKEPEDNPTRYNSVSMEGFAAYYKSTQVLESALNDTTVSIPTFAVIPQGDSVVDVEAVSSLLKTHFLSSTNQYLWLGEPESAPDFMTVYTMDLPEWKIGASSHMAPLFSPTNNLYGVNGRIRICDNGQSDDNTAKCQQGDDVWYGPWGLTADDKVYARLTFNPYFETMVERLHRFLDEAKQVQ